MSPSHGVVAADTLHELVILTFDLLILNSGHAWWVLWSIPPPSLKILCLYVFDWWAVMSAMGRDMVSVLRLSRDAPSSRVDKKITTSRSREADVSVSVICVSCPRRYFAQILQATLIKPIIMAVLTRIGNRSIYYLLTEVSSWRSDVIITCRPRPKPILTSLWRLVTYKRIVSVSSRNMNVSSRFHLGLVSVWGFNVSCPSLLLSIRMSMLRISSWDLCYTTMCKASQIAL